MSVPNIFLQDRIDLRGRFFRYGPHVAHIPDKTNFWMIYGIHDPFENGTFNHFAMSFHEHHYRSSICIITCFLQSTYYNIDGLIAIFFWKFIREYSYIWAMKLFSQLYKSPRFI